MVQRAGLAFLTFFGNETILTLIHHPNRKPPVEIVGHLLSIGFCVEVMPGGGVIVSTVLEFLLLYYVLTVKIWGYSRGLVL